MFDKIKLVEMSRKIKPNAAQQRRDKLVKQLQEQLMMAAAMLTCTQHALVASTTV